MVAALADRYRILRELGAGGMATVYLAEDVKHGRQVAVKVLRDDLTASLGKERFLREISIAAALTHPHILALYDSGEAAGRLFYVMPFVDGLSLRQRLVRTGEFPIGEAVRVLRDVADAMAHAHKRGVVHRDLKPENVMLSERHALVTDFGVAKALSAATGRQVLTTLGVALGTPTYMSPEQATADPQLDHRSDVYSFGVLAYELLTGHTPFEGGSPQEVLARHVTTAAAPITGHRASIPPMLAELVMRCLEKKPADRWQSAEEMLPQLEALLTPSGGITPHGTAPYAAVSAGAWSGRRRTALIAAGIVLVAAMGVVAYRKVGSSTKPSTDTASAAPVSVAILAPQNIGRAEDSVFADGLAAELRGALARHPRAQVRGSGSSQSFKGSTLSLGEIARKLGVPWIVTSTVQWTPTTAGGGRLRFAVELADVATDAVRWRQAYDTTLADAYRGQGAIAETAARDIARAVGMTESAVPMASPYSAAGVKPEAYTAYLLGRSAANKFTDDGLSESVGHFRRSVQLDPNFAKSQAWLGWSILYTRPWTRDSASAIASISRAIALAPDDADALMARGWLRAMQWNWQGARSDLLASLAKDPQNTWSYWRLLELETALGNFEHAVELGRIVASRDPVVAGDLYAAALMGIGRLDEAEAEVRAGLATDSLSTANLWWLHLADVLALRGDVVGYRQALRRFASLGHENWARPWLEAAALARAGRATEARALLPSLKRLVADGSLNALVIAQTYAALNEPDSVFAWLERGIQRHHTPIPSANSPWLAPLRKDPRFDAYLKRVGLR